MNKMSSPAANPILSLDDVHLKLNSDAGPVHILRGIDLEFNPGETVGVIGPSGSGKTSLLMVIAGLEPATSGKIVAVGQEITTLNEDQLTRFRRDHVGIVFQGFHLVPTMTAIENVALPMEFAGQSDVIDRARHHLLSVGLGERLHHFPGQLSGGEQQRVALARAFGMEPKILLADEPTGSLDHDSGQNIIALLFDLQKRVGTTMILVTHAPDLAGRCERVIRIADGKVADG